MRHFPARLPYCLRQPAGGRARGGGRGGGRQRTVSTGRGGESPTLPWLCLPFGVSRTADTTLVARALCGRRRVAGAAAAGGGRGVAARGGACVLSVGCGGGPMNSSAPR